MEPRPVTPTGSAVAKPSSNEVLALVAILILGTILRIGWPTLTEFKFSEARLEALALEVTDNGRVPLVGVPSSAGFDHSPLSVYLYVPPFLLGSNPILATVYGGLVNAAALFLCWWLARRWPGGGKWAAIIALLLFATSPWSVAFSRKIWQVAFVPLLTLLFVGLAVSALVGGRRWHLTWALLAFFVLVQIHPSAISLGLALVLWMVLCWRQVKLAPLFAGFALGALTAIPFLIHQASSGWPALSALRNLPAAVWDLSAVRLSWEAITGRGIHALSGDAYPLLQAVPQVGFVFNIIGWTAIASSLWAGWRILTQWRSSNSVMRRTSRIDMVVISWLLVPVLFNLRHSLDLHLHFFALLMPAAYLLIGRAAQALSEGLKGYQRAKVLALAGAALLAIAQVVSLVLMGLFVKSHQTNGGFGTTLGSYLHVTDAAVKHAQEKGAAEVLVVGEGNSPVVDGTAAVFDVLLRGRVPYRFVDADSAALFPAHRALALLDPDSGDAAFWYSSGRELAAMDGYRLVLLEGGSPQQDFEPISGLRLFENGAEIQAYGWSERSTRFWLLWQVLWESEDDTHFYVHFVGQDGTIVAQQDNAGYPTAMRRAGDRIITKFDIMLPEEAQELELSARLGVYTFPQVAAVPLIDQAGNPAGDVVLLDPLRQSER